MKNLKPLHVFDMNGTLLVKELSPICEAYARKNMFEPLFETLLNLDAEAWQTRFPEAAKYQISQETVCKRVLDIIANPPKFTKAREVYYNLIEAEIRNRRIDVGVERDILEKDSALMLLKEAGITTMLFSRGTVSIMEAIMDGTGLRPYFTLYDSTIPYGNNKVKDTYLSPLKALYKKDYEVAAFYEDEIAPLWEMYQAGKTIEKETRQFPFRLFWINRDNAPKETTGISSPDFWQKVDVYPNLLFRPV